MSNWVAGWQERNPEAQIVKRARRSVHALCDVEHTHGYFTGVPCHYLDEYGQWQPLDTKLIWDAILNEYGAPGMLVRIGLDGQVRITDPINPSISRHNQKSGRIGLFSTQTTAFSHITTLPDGLVDDDCLIREIGIYRQLLRLTEMGLREELHVLELPKNLPSSGDQYIVMETAMLGLDVPDGWLGELVHAGHTFPLPRVCDAAGITTEARRYAKKLGGIQYIYTGFLASEAAGLTYPVVIDPDFSADTDDAEVYGTNAAYATARSTATGSFNFTATLSTGQNTTYSVYRGFLKFDTSAIPDTDIVSQVNLKLTATADGSVTDFDVQIVKVDWSGQDPIGVANRDAAFDACLAGAADDSIWRNTNGMATNTPYTSGNLDTAWVDKTGDTYYGLRSSEDKNDSAPTGNEYVTLAAQEHGTAAYRPVLIVLYAPAVAGASGMVRAPIAGWCH